MSDRFASAVDAVAFPTLLEILRTRAEREPDSVAFILDDGDRDTDLTHAELDRRARAVAVAVGEHAGPGERVLLLLRPGPEYLAAFFGCLYAGAVAVPAYPPTARDADRLAAVVASAAPTVVLTHDEFVEPARNMLASIMPAGVRWLGVERTGDAERWTPPAIGGDTIAFVQYTSGSTSAPRGVVLTHEHLLANLEVVARRFGTGPDSVGCSWLPPYHDMGLIGAILQPVYRGFPMVLMSPESFVRDPAVWLRAISRHRVTVSGGPNFAFEMCVRRVPERERAALDLSTWSVAFNGAEPVRAETLERFAAAFADAGFRPTSWFPCYGLAEATLMVTGGDLAAPPVVRRFDAAAITRDEVVRAEGGRPLVSCGRVADGHELIVVDPGTRRPNPPGRVGELWVRGPSVAVGYWDDPAATEAVFGARLAGEHTGPGFLRTGDLAFLDGGELFVAGRLKDVVIVRGRNHHPADLEATVAGSHPALRATGVVFGVARGGEEAVVSVHEARPETAAADLAAAAAAADLAAAAAAARSAVAAAHGLHLAEIVLVGPGEVPRTSSGKPRRVACRDRYLAGELESRLVSAAPTDPPPAPNDAGTPADEADLALRTIALVDEPAARRALATTYLRVRLATRLGLPADAVTADTPVGTLGLDSLGAIEFAETVHRELGVELTVDALLGATTPATLASDLVGPVGAGRPVPRPDPAAPVPLSHAQERLWFMHQMDPAGDGYTIVAAFGVRGPLRAADLAEALRLVVADHEALRTVVRTEDGVPAQVVLPDVEIPLERIDPPGDTAAERRAVAVSLLGEWAGRPFQLDRPPLLRAALCVVDSGDHDSEHLVAFAGHHVVFDAWSIRILLADLGRHYAALGAGTVPVRCAPEIQLADFALWQRTAPALAVRRERDLAYWRERLRAVPPLGLPADRPRPKLPTTRGAGEPFTVPDPVPAAAARLAREHDATPFMVLLAAWKTLLSRHSGQADITVGVPVSTRGVAGVTDTVGCFVDTLVLRTDLGGDPTFAELLVRVREGTREAYAHPAAPMDRLVEELNVQRHGRNPLFEASFSLFPEFDALDALPGVELDVVEIETGHVQFDLVLEMMPLGAALRGRIRYTSDLYTAATVRRLTERFTRLLTLVTEDPGRPLSHYDLMGTGEWDRLLRRQPPADPFGPVPAPLQEPFEAHAGRHPNDVAFVDDAGTWTYAEADARANRIAHLLREHGVGPEILVGLAMAAGAELVITMLGILKSGGAYVPVEPTDPPARLRDLLTDAGTRVVLTDSDTVEAALAGSGVETIRIDRTGADLDRWPASRPEPVAAPHHLAYVIFTSGSTGRPKGVAVEHRHIVSFVRATADYLGSRRGDVYAMVSSIAADLGLTTLLPALCTGGTVHVVPKHVAVDPLSLAQRFRDIRLDHLKIAPSHLSTLLLAPSGAAILPARTLVLGGEAVSWELVDRLREQAPDVAVVNEYGPTETAVANIIHHVRDDGSDRVTPLVPMTVCLGGNRAYVLDEHRCPVPVGVPGELYLGGPQVARGYLNRPEITVERFLPDPYHDAPDARMYATGDRVRWLDESTMEFYGRLDNQVKVRGYRVELCEVESALRQHERVSDAVVLAFRDAAGDHGLVGYAVPEPGTAVDESELREHLRARLPGHMVPADLLVLPRLPVLPQGKVDRDALRAMPPSRRKGAAGGAPPEDRTQRALAEIWCELLDVEHVGLDDNFFDVGGHSVLLVRLQHRIGERLGHEISVLDLMVNPTVCTQAMRLTAAGVPDERDDPAVARARAGLDARHRLRRRGAKP